MPLADGAKPFPIIEVSFKRGSRKDFFRNTSAALLVKDDWVTVEGSGGYDVGQVSLQGELVKLQMKKHHVDSTAELKKVLRPSSEAEIEQYHVQKEREQEFLVRSRAIARSLALEMKIAEVELQADGRKATFFYTADQRVDFRELIRRYAADFHIKVEMRQIGARQESGKVGGIGSCGRELCCATWLTDFKTVNTAAARYQNLSINQTKLSGQCGRLKCCLNYELDTYMDALKAFPTDADSIETMQGRATLQKRDIFRSLMWYSYAGSNAQYPLSIDRVKEIKSLNKDGQKPEELGAAEITSERRPGSRYADEGDHSFVNDVGQISLRALERNAKARKKKAARKAEGKAQEGGQGNRPQKQGGDKPAAPKQEGQQPKQKAGGAPPKQPGNSPKQQHNPNRDQQRQPRPEGRRPPRNRGGKPGPASEGGEGIA
jgi:cell fate regulator YaaT (PSP1 superfamily)